MSTEHQEQWSTEIYRVFDHDSQQRILEAFCTDAQHAVTALGTHNGPDWFVIVETASIKDRLEALQTIFALDAVATRIQSSKPPQLTGPMPAS